MSAVEDSNELVHPRWATIWRTEETPKFDKLSVSPALQALINSGAIPIGNALVPGCGRGYDVTALASATRHCLGLDIVPEAIHLAKDRLKQLLEKVSLPLAPCSLPFFFPPKSKPITLIKKKGFFFSQPSSRVSMRILF